MFGNHVFGLARAGMLAVFGLASLGLMVVTSAMAEEENKVGWTGELAVSVTAQSGSVDTFAGVIDAQTERKWTEDLVGFRFLGIYGTTRDRSGARSKNKTIQNSQGIYGDWKHTIHDRFFWDTSGEISRDSTQDREARARIVTGPGYRIWAGENGDKSHFDLSGGLGYRYELYDGNTDSVAATRVDGTDQHLADVVAAFEYKNMLFDDRIEFTHTGSASMPVNKVEAYIITTEMIARVPLSGAWSLRTSVLYDYVNDVPNNQNPSTLRVTLGLGYKF